jgi:VanZ family protein
MSEKKRRVLSTVLICLGIATVAFIWGNSMLGSKASSNVSNSVLDALEPIIRRFGIVSENDLLLRKLAHFTEFAALGAELLFLAAVNRKSGFQTASNCAFASLLVALTDETIQLISGRNSQVLDVLLDFSGALTGILIAWLIYRLIKKRRAL